MSVSEYTMKWGLGGDPSDENATLYREDRNSGEETFAQGGSGSVRTLYTPYRVRDRAIRNFLGETQLSQVGDFYYPSRMIPNYHPDFFMTPFASLGDIFQVPYLWADSLSFVGQFADTLNPKSYFVDSCDAAAGAFLEARMMPKYTSYPYFVLTDEQMLAMNAIVGDPGSWDESTMLRYVFAKKIASPKYQTLPRVDTIAWALDNEPMATTAAQLMPEGDLLLKWFNIPIPLYDGTLVESLIGRTNDTDFGHPFAPQGVFKRGSLVFCPPDVDPFPRANGETYLNITYRFRYYPKGANYFFRYNVKTDGLPGVDGLSGTELSRGPGFYLATRKYQRRGVGGGAVGRPRALSDTEMNACDGYFAAGGSLQREGAVGSVLLFPFDNFANLFRARVDKSSIIPFSGIV